ncbi:MAG TPA: response regulator [Vicinamibacterales bacterium]|nr:response regulator [Vicinamibacterales bacterium]
MGDSRAESNPLVLLAEDDHDSREMYVFALELAGFRTAQAASGEEALARAIELSPDVIVTDLNLPGVDGYELCERLKSDPATARAQLLALTGSSLAEDAERARAAGCARVLVKPFPPDHLGEEITRVLTAAKSS